MVGWDLGRGCATMRVDLLLLWSNRTEPLGIAGSARLATRQAGRQAGEASRQAGRQAIGNEFDRLKPTASLLGRASLPAALSPLSAARLCLLHPPPTSHLPHPVLLILLVVSPGVSLPLSSCSTGFLGNKEGAPPPPPAHGKHPVLRSYITPVLLV